MTGRRSLQILLLASLAFGGLAGLAVCRWHVPYTATVRPVEMRGAWVRPPDLPGYSGYLRRRVTLSGPIKHAWIAVSAIEAFEVTVNGVSMGHQFLWRASRPFQYGLSERGQAVDDLLPSLALNYPREYQWGDQRRDRLPLILDLTPQLHEGLNVIGLAIESRHAPVLARCDGEIELWSGRRIGLESGPEWLAEPVPPAHPPFVWTEPGYPDRGWRNAVVVDDLDRAVAQYQSFDPRAVTTPIGGQWLRHPRAGSGEAVWLETTWNLEQRPSEAWIRIAANRAYDLFVNGRRVRASASGRRDLGAGEWIFGTQRATDPVAMPQLIDPGEIDSLFADGPFEFPRPSPRDRDEWPPRSGEAPAFAIRPGPDPQQAGRMQSAGSSPLERGRPPSSNAASGSGFGGEGRPALDQARPSIAESPSPLALATEREGGSIEAYGIRWMLRAGRNTIAVRLAPPMGTEPLNWQPQVALDAEATSPTGARSALSSGSSPGWECLRQDRAGRRFDRSTPVATGPGLAVGVRLPGIRYLGLSYSFADKVADWALWGGLTTAGSVLALFSILAAQSVIRGGVVGRYGIDGDRGAALRAAARALAEILITPSVVLSTALLVECTWMERSEILLFRRPATWPLILSAALVLGLLVALGGRRSPRRGINGWIRNLPSFLLDLPNARLWWFVVGGLLVLCALARMYKIDFQPFDDDEYASTQAFLGIARTGLPRLVPEEVWYTRSPLFHYLVGAIVKLAGENVWAMRLPSVWFGVATALLLYLCGSRLLNRPWVGLGALALYSIHPLAVYLGHIARFYQQQQFFMLLCIYWFCRGFVREGSQRYRYLTLAAFLASVLSQEIAAVMGFPIALGALLFARDHGVRANLRLLVAVGCVLAMVALDFAVFQSRCLTRLEGISTHVEASIRPHFWNPFNLATLFLSYSRLHVIPSVLLLLGIPSLVFRRDRIACSLLWFFSSGILLTNLLVNGVSIRYVYFLLPLFILLSILGLDAGTSGLVRYVADRHAVGRVNPWVRPISTAVIFLGIVLAMSPWRLAWSYESKLVGDSTGAYQFMRSQLREGDVIIATEPHPHAAILEAGRVDYDLSVPIAYDFFLLKEGRLLDRNGGAKAVVNVDQLREICKRSPRVWVVLNREKFRTKGHDILWQFPGARLELFIRRNFVNVRNFPLCSVFLWDAARGEYQAFREHADY